MEIIRKHLWISGRVQGVFFRASTRDMARQLGEVNGWVRNLLDGRVEVVAEGPFTKVENLIHWCHQGPSSAKVTGVTIKTETPTGEFQEFYVR